MRDRVQRELWLDASPAELWEAITADGWLADAVRLELWPGGEAEFDGPEGERRGWVEEASPPGDPGESGRLAFWWAADGEAASRVELTLDRDGALTRLRVVETRPLELLDLIGTPLSRISGRTYGPALAA